MKNIMLKMVKPLVAAITGGTRFVASAIGRGALVATAICAATGNALATENIINYNTPGGTYNYDEGTTINKPGVHQRILVKSGTVNINTGAYVKAGGDATGECNYVGVDNSGPAYLNINGGTVWCATDGGGAGHLGIGINNCAQPATVTLNSGLLRVDTQVRSATWWDSCNGTTSSGALVVNGGEAYVGQFVIGAHTASTGTSELTLNGGSLTVEKLLFLQYNGQVFTWGNGTLVAARDNIFVVNAYTSQNNKTRTMEIAGTPATFNTGGFAQVLPAFTGTGGLTVTGTGGSITVSGSQAFTGDLTLSNGTALVVTDSATFAGRIVLGGANSKIRVDTANSQENVITLSATGYSVPSGSILDYVELTDSSNYTATSSGNTITVTLNDPVATWTGTANDGSPANAANWCVTQGETVLGNTLPDGNTVVVMQGQNVNMQLPSGSTLACKSFEIRDCTFTADCDWRGLSVTPVIIGTANLDGHVLKLNNLSAEYGSTFSGGAGSVVEFVVDESATIANLYEYTYIENIGNLAFSGSANIRLRKMDGGGTLTATRLELGNQLNGDMVQTNGTVNITSGANAVGESSGKTATYTMSGGSLTSAGEFKVGANGTGVFNQSGGTVTLNNWFSIGRNAGGNGTYTMTGGSLTHSGNTLWIGAGDNWGMLGTGTLTIGGDATATFSVGIDIGRNYGATGNLNLNGGTLTVSRGDGFNIGRDGTGTLVQNGGTLTANEGGTASNINNVWRIAWGVGYTGSYTLNGGTAIAKSNFYIGDGGTATYVQNGGTLIAENGVTLAVGNTAQTTFTLSGGVFNTKHIQKGSGSVSATFNGGTIVATNVTNGANFITGLNNVKYGPGGLTLDTAGYDVTMAAARGAASAGSSFVKVGTGILTMDALPSTDAVVVNNGTLALSASCTNAIPAFLAHRWSFNGDYSDSVGALTATPTGSPTFSDGKLVLPGGSKGTANVDLGAGALSVGSDSITIEIWARQNQALRYARIFDYYSGDGSDKNNDIYMAWNTADNNYNTDKVEVKSGGSVKFNAANQLQPYSQGTMYHISMVISTNANGSTTVSYAKRNTTSGVVEKSYSNTINSWTLSDFHALAGSPHLHLGCSLWGESDPKADYDEVRIWNVALSTDALTLSAQKGPDATAADLAEIAAATSAALPVKRTIEIASGATLDLGAGNTLTQPVVSGSGTVQNGTLNVTEKLSPGGDGVVGTIAINSTAVVTGTIRLDYGDAITTTGSVDLSNATIDLAFTPTEGGTVATASGSGTFTGVPAFTVNGETPPSRWQLVKSSDGKNIVIKDVAPATAYWTGLGDLTDVNDPDNWACTNAVGAEVSACPGIGTVVHVSGATSFNVPAGQTLAYKELWFDNCSLAANCDWSGLASSETVGPVYALEYLDAPQNAYIDTGFAPNNNTRVVMDVTVSRTTESYFGVSDDDSNNNWWNTKCFGVSNDGTGVYCGFGNQGGTPGGTVVANGRHTIDFYNGVLKVDDVARVTRTGTFQLERSLYLFADNRGSTVNTKSGTVRFHSCQIYDDGTLVRDYVPVQYADVVCLYDRVSGTYAMNIGNAALAAGTATSEIVGYHSVTVPASINGTIDLAGHSLTLAHAAGTGTITDTVGGGELHIGVASDESLENSSLTFTGLMKLVVEGGGTFTASKASQSYTGGTVVSNNTTIAAGTVTHPFGNGNATQTITLKENAVYNNQGNKNGETASGSTSCYNFELYEGSLMQFPSTDSGSRKIWHFGTIVLHGNATFYGTGRAYLGGKFDGSTEATRNITLNGYTLTVDNPWANGNSIQVDHVATTDAGTISFVAGNLQVDTLLRDFSRSSVEFSGNTSLVLYQNKFWISNLVYTVSSQNWTVYNSAKVQVYGRYRAGQYRPPILMMNGSTLDLSDVSGTWDASGTATGNNVSGKTGLVLIDSGAAVTVDLSGRTDLLAIAQSANPYIVTWGSQPNATFTLDAATSEHFALKPDGTGIKIVMKLALTQPDGGSLDVEAGGTDLLSRIGLTSAATPSEVNAALNATDPNGLRRWENLVTGTATNQPPLGMVSAETASGKALTLSVKMVSDTNETAKVDLGYEVLRELRKDDGTRVAGPSPDGTAFDIELLNSEGTSSGASGLYRVVTLLAYGSVTNEIPSTNAVGIVEVASTATNTITAVPWKRLASAPGAASDLTVSNFVAFANLSAGDAVYMLDGRAYKMWKKKNDGTWEAATTVSGNGASISIKEAGAPDVATIPCGGAVWVQRADTTKPYFLVGQYDESAFSVTVPGSGAALIANPFPTNVTLNAIDWSGYTGINKDTIRIPRNGLHVDLSYDSASGKWGYYNDVPVINNGIFTGATFVPYTDPIPAGSGFIYDREGGEGFTFEWK